MQIHRYSERAIATFCSRGSTPAHLEGVRFMRLRSLLVAFVCLAIVAPLASAQTTGTVSGVVKNKDGGSLPGVTVTISGPQMPRGQTTTTRSDGSFKFQALLPCTYHSA